LKHRFILFPVLLFTTFMAAGTDKPSNEIDWDALRYDIENLSRVAATCLEGKSRKSESCVDFVKQYRADGEAKVTLFSEHATVLLSKDLEATLNTVQHITVISEAFLFIAKQKKRS